LGFSLLELLVVTALLGTLVALLMPAFNQARERSRAALCVGHLRQIGQATLMYHDEQGQLPASNLPGYLLWNGLSFVLYGDIVLSHGRDMAKVFYCPSDRVFEPGSTATGINNLGVPNKVTASSYYVRSVPQGAPVRLTGSTKALFPAASTSFILMVPWRSPPFPADGTLTPPTLGIRSTVAKNSSCPDRVPDSGQVDTMDLVLLLCGVGFRA
jgi:type II secretory pathway pseudopilin PulG